MIASVCQVGSCSLFKANSLKNCRGAWTHSKFTEKVIEVVSFAGGVIPCTKT